MCELRRKLGGKSSLSEKNGGQSHRPGNNHEGFTKCIKKCKTQCSKRSFEKIRCLDEKTGFRLNYNKSTIL